MKNQKVINLIDKAIDAGKKGTYELSDVYDELDNILETTGKESILRHYFDCWADAVNHDYMVYKTKEPKQWVEAAKELRSWYINDNAILSKRELWEESLPNNF